jgi:hypothetical protein
LVLSNPKSREEIIEMRIRQDQEQAGQEDLMVDAPPGQSKASFHPFQQGLMELGE